jgi:hypothetical protein
VALSSALLRRFSDVSQPVRSKGVLSGLLSRLLLPRHEAPWNDSVGVRAKNEGKYIW